MSTNERTLAGARLTWPTLAGLAWLSLAGPVAAQDGADMVFGEEEVDLSPNSAVSHSQTPVTEVSVEVERAPAAVDDERPPSPAELEEAAAEEAEAEAEADLEVAGLDINIDPFVTIVGGGYYQHIDNREDLVDERENRFTTVALSRLGLRASIGDHLSVVSEIELNAGPYGTSVWEGQAAIQVRNQLLRLDYGGLRIDAGRITDPASLDYFSAYVANTLLTDDLTRFPLLVSGFNRGNGVLARYEIFEGFKAGFTVNAGNPTSTTGTVMVGGTFPPFARFYEVAWSNVGRDARGFPTSSFHAMLISPSLTYDHEYFSIQSAFQWFDVNTNTNTTSDEHINGFNIRGGVQLKFLDGSIRPFFNASRIINETVDPTDTSIIQNEFYEAITLSGGLDFNFAFTGLDVLEDLGFGLQYASVQEQQGELEVLSRHIFNTGASWWFIPGVASLDARYGYQLVCEGDNCGTDEEHRAYLTLKAVLGAVGNTNRRP